MRFLKTVLIILSFIHLNAEAQSISGLVLDLETKKPVPFANVFFNNSYNGTISDIEGNFKLEIGQNLGQELVVSYLGYESQLIEDYQAGKFYKVYLTPNALKLEEIVLIADKISRKKKIKIFLREFLGQSKNAKKCTIENLDDLRLVYDKSSDKLVAFSTNPLIIHNKALGYRITYYLEEFEKTKNKIGYTGYSKFEESIIKSDNSLKRIERKRRKTYLGSIMHFYRALWENQLKQSKFSVFDVKSKNAIVVENNIQKLNDDVKYLTNSNPLKILYNAHKVSYLTLETDKRIFFTRNGYFNPKGHYWQGEMAIQRIGDLLPYEYNPELVKE